MSKLTHRLGDEEPCYPSDAKLKINQELNQQQPACVASKTAGLCEPMRMRMKCVPSSRYLLGMRMHRLSPVRTQTWALSFLTTVHLSLPSRQQRELSSLHYNFFLGSKENYPLYICAGSRNRANNRDLDLIQEKFKCAPEDTLP